MKQTAKITLSGMMAALAVVCMLLAYFPYFTYAVPALAGLFLMVLVIEIDCKWAFCAYIASAVLVFLFAEPEAKLLYICFFGLYPILKARIERLRKAAVEWILKLAVFNAAMLLAYGLLSLLTDISLSEFDTFGQYGAYLFLAAGNVVFVLYDIAVSRVSTFYLCRLHPKIRRLF